MDGTLTVHTDDYRKIHNDLRYKAYSDVTGHPIDDKLIQEYEGLYKKYGSNSMIFTKLGKQSDFWMQYFDQIDQTRYYEPIPEIYKTLEQLKNIMPISLFTNAKLTNAHRTLKVIDIDSNWFSNIVTGDDVPKRKPALDGFHIIIDKSRLPAENILYVGDRVKVDITPANKIGMQSCLLYKSSDEATYSFEKFEELLTLFK